MNNSSFKIVKRILMVFFVVGIATFFGIRANSFELALKREGFHQPYGVIEHSFDIEDNEYKVIKAMKNNESALAVVTKNKYGSWTVTNQSFSDPEQKQDYLCLRWIGDVAYNYFDMNNPEHVWEHHIIYYGDNAVEELEFMPGQIPENVAVDIEQNREEYCIYITSYAGSEKLNEFDIISVLRENGCIE